MINALLWFKSHNETYKNVSIDADSNPVSDLIERTMQGDTNLERSQHTPVCSADCNLEREQPEEQLRLRPQGTRDEEVVNC